MPAKFAECEVWVLVDESGDYVCAKQSDDLSQLYEDEMGEVELGRRYVKLTVRVPLPTPIEITADVPAEEGEPSVRVS
jgi:phosphoenolpyruvate carboxylase